MKIRWVTLLIAAGALASCGGTTTEGSSGQAAMAEHPGPGDVEQPADGEHATAPDSQTLAECAPLSAPALFSRALCICEDLRDIGALRVSRGSSGQAAVLAINGAYSAVSQTTVEGSLIAHGGLTAVANIDVDADLKSAGDVSVIGRLTVGRDLMVGGDLSGLGGVKVASALGVGGSNRLLGAKSADRVRAYERIGPPPCDCTSDDTLDVVETVAAARNANDNERAGLQAAPLKHIGHTELTLEDGHYYFGSTASIGSTHIVVKGAVSVYIDGDLDAIGRDRFELTEGATLDLYVAGSVRTIGQMQFGNQHEPSAFRLYIGGKEAATLQIGSQVFHGSIFAPHAALKYIGRTKIEGALLARTLDSIGLLELSYGRPTTAEGQECTIPAAQGPDSQDPPPSVDADTADPDDPGFASSDPGSDAPDDSRSPADELY